MAEMGYPYSGGVFGQDPQAVRKQQLSSLLFGLGAGLIGDRGMASGIGKGALFGNELAQQAQENELKRMLFGLQQREAELNQGKFGLMQNQDTREEKKLQYDLSKIEAPKIDDIYDPATGRKRRGYFNSQGQWTDIGGVASPDEGGNTSPYYTPVYTGQGVNAFNNRTGGIGPALGQPLGQPILRTSDDPAIRGAVAGAENLAKAPTSSTAQDELILGDKAASSAENAIGILSSIITKDPQTGKSQNDTAFEGGLANWRALGTTFVPGKYRGADDLIDMENKLTGTALEQMRAVFGANPTEGERKILIDLQGAVNLKANQREEIIKRGIELMKARRRQTVGRMEKIRSGKFFNPTAAPPSIDDLLNKYGGP